EVSRSYPPRLAQPDATECGVAAGLGCSTTAVYYYAAHVAPRWCIQGSRRSTSPSRAVAACRLAVAAAVASPPSRETAGRLARRDRRLRRRRSLTRPLQRPPRGLARLGYLAARLGRQRIGELRRLGRQPALRRRS